MRGLPAAAALGWIAASMTAMGADTHLTEGTPQSPVRVVIYEDLQCPDCADFRTLLDQQVLPRYPATVVFEYRDFPLAKHAWARKAAVASRFLEGTQPGAGLAFRKYALTNLSHINTDNFNPIHSQFAEAHGVDPAKAIIALTYPRSTGLVDKDYQEGVARGVARTPTVLVNGRLLVETFTFEELEKAIDGELAAAK
jgi:protein-disulfide isomerase